ncbi:MULTISPECIES: ABC transporter transmembrane domain-containing protein [Nocardiaceae]|uniref:ABC transporter transmembrane domain-containing protein n=1 Tax=Nocardiaceae TaxID=85025 RepID=UPI0005650FFD|nr:MULTISPECIES: ABC transporter ATP-binding protein [Rhodococcus]OZF05628.1 ABC transporter ATP-binding protein [Rhodococcus sp. 15-1189-1-1a]OZF20410.1 ABC transporter ATP-binding protein [Rhodococcus sp. 14-2686-1-2]OZF56497.1 ABC transporter ATP-binding protein [Rhodococcus sp. 14-2470-1b]
MTSAWNPPKHIPVFFDIPDTPPQRRIRIRDGMSPLRLSASIIRSAGWHAALGCLLLVLYNTATTLVPLALGAAIDRGIGPVTTGTPAGEAVRGFLQWLAVIAGLYVVMNLTYRFGGRIGWFAVQRAKYELSSRVIERILDARGTAGGPQLPGRLLSVATSDSDRASSAIYFAVYPLGHIVAIVVAAVSLFAIHPVLGLTVILGSPLLLALMAVVARPLQRRAEEEQDAVADAAGIAADLVSGYRVITGIHAQRAATDHYRGVSRSALRGTLAANRAEGAVIGINNALTGLFAGVVTVIAAMLTFNGSITIGGLIAAAAMAQVLLDPLRSLIEDAATLGAMVLASAKRVLDQLHIGPDPEALGTAPIPESPTLRIHSPQMTDPILVTPGEFLVIDPSAIDADGLVAAMTLTSRGEQDKTPGITLDGRPLREHDPAEVRRRILVSPHQPDLLEPTLFANVASAEAVPGSAEHTSARGALQAARCDGLEHELRDGYDTDIGDGGRTLSGGQRQRVALARALHRRPPVLVLHDPTNSVDSATEHDIATRVRSAREGLTTIVITSSPAFHAVSTHSIAGEHS